MKRYNKTNLPKTGNAKKIWDALSPDIIELHYNPNLWGCDRLSGWGTWACEFDDRHLFWCGSNKEGVYVQEMSAPFKKRYVKTVEV